MIPDVTLTTDRLILRPPQEDDFDAVAAYVASPRARFTGGTSDDQFHAWRGFLGVMGHWCLRGYGMFTVCRPDGTRLGRVGIINHIMWDEPELGWQLFDGYEGFGYATEAAIAARDWAAAAHGLGPLISYIHAENTRSRRVAERMGARYERDTVLLGHEAQVWRHEEGQG
ncbi:GNAT family N-acetyltransferase [Pseudoponticoccus marisrubri]|uniref:N-acetyltransferase domain-containing protein n=1 Tax=Pseudoponticoccus marisrubri TaxID=1685382 RepID=A0A0W7WFU0_9RHOB|nr:GNAT family N-acetyltransferase [Pseudoponticoccus marisrubri]KUF09453.1 hypothetical protein AVJ23_17585 [Pseudoponticoccus marisrubri]